MYANQGILNPEFLSILNPRAGPRKILFHANDVDLCESEAAIPEDFAQFICARRIDLWTLLVDEPHRNNFFRFIMGTGNALQKFFIHSLKSYQQREFCEFLVKVNFDYYSFL
jgi:hypothetical protein